MKSRLLTLALFAGILFSPGLKAQTTLYGITDANTIFTISNVSDPSSISGPYSVSGVASGQVLVGLDARPGNSGLYALGYDSATTTAQLYMITGSGGTYTATAVGSATTAINLGATINVAFDFVSTMDNEIRIIGRNGNNYIMDADNGTVMSTGVSSLSFAVGDIHTGASDAVAATAYTNSFYGADATDEVGYDATNNILVTFDSGSYSNGFNNASYTIHSIGIGTGLLFTSGSNIGMDAWYDTATHNNVLYLSGTTLLGGNHLYMYDMTSGTGALTDLGAIGGGTMNVLDIAFSALGPSTAAVTGYLMAGLSLNLRNLIFFDSQNPAHISLVRALHGLTTGQNMIAIDYSLSSGMLYGFGYNSTAQTYQLYTIDTATGNVTAVNATPANIALGTDDGSGSHINIGFRFIPTLADDIRVTGNNGSLNVQIDAATGIVTTSDAALSYITGDISFGAMPNLTSIAFTGYDGDTATQSFGFDASTGAIVMFDLTNSLSGFGIGASGYINTDVSLNTILSLLLHTSAYNNSYMDIMYDPALYSNVGFLASDYYGDSSDQQNYSVLYDMRDMLTGYHRGTSITPAAVGPIGYGTPVKDAVMRKTPITTGVMALANNNTNNLLVYPNPVISDTHIVLPIVTKTIVYVDIIDLNGNIVRCYQYPTGSNILDVNMSNLPTSLYSVRVYNQELGSYNLKVVKE